MHGDQAVATTVPEGSILFSDALADTVRGHVRREGEGDLRLAFLEPQEGEHDPQGIGGFGMPQGPDVVRKVTVGGLLIQVDGPAEGFPVEVTRPLIGVPNGYLKVQPPTARVIRVPWRDVDAAFAIEETSQIVGRGHRGIHGANHITPKEA